MSILKDTTLTKYSLSENGNSSLFGNISVEFINKLKKNYLN